MDNNLAENVQDVDNGNEPNQAMEDCLRNPVIVRKICEYVSSRQLLQFSLVNRLWNYEARSVVEKRGNLIANLRSHRNRLPGETCEAVVAFVRDLPKLGAAPFFGINFENFYHNHVCSPGDLARIHDVNLLDQLSLKNISVRRFGRSWPQLTNCPAILLANKVLKKFCGVLEELELNIRGRHGDDIEKVIQACNFPRLKILKISALSPQMDIETLIRGLLSRVPNLKTLHTDWNINSVLCLLQGTSIQFVYTTPVSAPFDEVSENVIGAFGLEWIKLIYTGPGFNFERFNRIAPILLQAPQSTTIRHFHMDAMLAVPLMCYGTRLENVRNLWMDIDHGRLERMEPRILNIVKNCDFTRIFPNLNTVNVTSKTNYNGLPQENMNAFIAQANAILREPLPDRAAHIKRLHLADCTCSVAIQFFVEMFPNIQKIEITPGARRPIPFGSIWNWSDLNELQVRGNVLPTTRNLDSVFCGIFPEEVEELRRKDDEYLKKVNIVPVMPAVTCLRILRTISLYHRHDPEVPFGDDDATFVFSKVTALLAFARLPTLAVSLNISAREAPPAMDHLKPYVTVTSDVI